MTELIIKVDDDFLREAKLKGMEEQYELVRCKDCKRVNTIRCPFYDAGWGYTDDDFCSCGERGEQDDSF